MARSYSSKPKKGMQCHYYYTFHSELNYTIDDVSIKNQDGNSIGVNNMMFYKPNQFVIIETDQECTKGEVYTLTVSEYVAELTDDLTGLYRASYKENDGTDK